ncbi:uncharacterized protein K460DRAFT_285385 [Cucurbitaria berberidis CBS 394.84]|uniref:N-acetyltransferase domain-containing protein n=1 Tax=Cucurbitaria berberidis CBS 394.84 TaxID=1168544 RepID=A0A9P4L968_9PLEO|nr:uncharacterized protein K460DRAFT_285385 [Cucurbitaria berberidis CBS 394.84]KAF1846846.1 hypothetical protein K460DRAFT_285385 [Cucurbitaria berberidis CBS 394.84]
MSNAQQPSKPPVDKPERAYHDLSDTNVVEYLIRSDANHLQEDPDIEENIVYRVTPGSQITNNQLIACSRHFSSYYGVWSEFASPALGMSPNTLKGHSLPQGANNILITALNMNEAGRQIAHCFVSEWAHENGRIWWITQLVVLPSYRNQRRATKMLKALVLHYDIGKRTNLRDFVGVLSPHPYTLSAVLRVFARGIESLPSKTDWEKTPAQYPYAPLQGSHYAPIMKSSPVEYVRNATPCPDTLTAKTNLYLNHTETDLALQRIVFAINKQVRQPWQWLFSDLAEGFEYLCVLDFQYDPEYKMRPQFGDEAQVFLSEIPLEESVTRSLVKLAQSPVDYAGINKYLISALACCNDGTMRLHQKHNSKTDEVSDKKVLEARDLIGKHCLVIRQTMNAKRIPENLRPTFDRGQYPLPDHLLTWKDLRIYAQDSFEDDETLSARLVILQTIHFKELLDESERLRKDPAEDSGEEEEEQDQENVRKERSSPQRTLVVDDTTSPETVNPVAETPTLAPVSDAMCNLKECRPAVPPQGRASGSMPKRSNIPLRVDSDRAPKSNSPTPSPRLFFPSGSSREAFRSSIPVRQLPRNSGNALSREKWSGSL